METTSSVKASKCRVCERVLKNPKWAVLQVGPVCARKGGYKSGLKPIATPTDERFLDTPDADVVLCRGSDNIVSTNIPHFVDLHSRGFEWGEDLCDSVKNAARSSDPKNIDAPSSKETGSVLSRLAGAFFRTPDTSDGSGGAVTAKKSGGEILNGCSDPTQGKPSEVRARAADTAIANTRSTSTIKPEGTKTIKNQEVLDSRRLKNSQNDSSSSAPTAISRFTRKSSGSENLALNILIRFGCDLSEAQQLHQDFKRDFIATIPRIGGRIPSAVVRGWILEKRNGREEISP